MNESVWLVIAAYNEAKVIRSVLENALQVFPNIVVVNDGSKDGTEEEVLATSAWYIPHPINLGQGAALQTGITFALKQGAEFVATFDADGQHDPHDVLQMCQLLTLNNVDVVLGSRFKGEAIGITPVKRIFLKLATWFTNVTSGVKLTDAHNGLRLFSRHAAQKIKIRQNRMSHASEIVDLLGKLNLSYMECPVTIRYTEYSIAKGQRMTNALSVLMSQFFSKFHR